MQSPNRANNDGDNSKTFKSTNYFSDKEDSAFIKIQANESMFSLTKDIASDNKV
jgi:hypothetical protein